MRVLFAIAFAVAILGLFMFQTIPESVAAPQHELSYDDGKPGDSVSLTYAPQQWSGDECGLVWISSQMLAVMFTPDNSTLQMLVGLAST